MCAKLTGQSAAEVFCGNLTSGIHILQHRSRSTINITVRALQNELNLYNRALHFIALNLVQDTKSKVKRGKTLNFHSPAVVGDTVPSERPKLQQHLC